MKISTKYSLMTSALVGAVVAATAWSVTRSQREILQAQAGQRLEAVMDGVERLAVESVESRDDLMLVSYLMFLKKSRPELAHAAVSRKGHTSHLGAPDLNLLYLNRSVSARRSVTYTVTAHPTTADPAAALSLSSAGVSLNIPGDALVRIDEPRRPEITEIKLGFLRERISAELNNALKPLLKRTLAIAGTFMGLGLLGSLALGKLLTGPLTALTAAVAKVEHGELDVSVAASGSDEVGDLARRFNAMTTHIRDLMQFREDILHTLTHELNNPLMGLKSYLELWRDRPLPAEAAARGEALESMTAAVTRMESSLGSALGLFKSEAGAPAAPPQVVWVDEILRDALTLHAPVARSKSILVSPPSEEARAFVVAPLETLRQIVFNLVSNALKYTPSDGAVALGLEEEAGEVRFWVKDSGPGISAEDLPHLFTKFYRPARPGERIPGTGLGLSIAKKAAQSLGGTLRVESSAGKGSTFFVTIPKLARTAGGNR